MNGNNMQQGLDPQMIQQVLQYLQQNGQQTAPTQIPNWNLPTNPYYMMWMNGLNNAMMNQNQNTAQSRQPVPAQNQTPEPQQQPAQSDDSVLSVRIVKSSDDIKPAEIPMNGSMSLFMLEDMSCIYGKRWTNNGVIETIQFVQDDTQNVEIKNPITTDNFIDMNDLANRISGMIDSKLDAFRKELSESRSNKKPNPKKEVSENAE